MNNNWCLYIHTNIMNDKKYIGITSQQPEKRWLNGRGYEAHLPFGKAIRKYGWDGFYHDVMINNLTEQQAKIIERHLIQELHTQDRDYGYNMTAGGDGVCGYKHTNESRLKMSAAKAGKSTGPRSEETCQKIAHGLVGNKNCLGVTRSCETREKMSAAKRKPVAMYDESKLLNIFPSAKDAEIMTGINRKNISMCCLNKRKHAGGYVWKFA